MDGSVTDSQLPRSNKLVLIVSPFSFVRNKIKSLLSSLYTKLIVRMATELLAGIAYAFFIIRIHTHILPPFLFISRWIVQFCTI
jgi:hypothetical protein